MRKMRQSWRAAALWFAACDWMPRTWFAGALAVALATCVLGALLAPALWPHVYWTASSALRNQGFGPDWECSNTARNVCFRKIPATPAVK